MSSSSAKAPQDPDIMSSSIDDEDVEASIRSVEVQLTEMMNQLNVNITSDPSAPAAKKRKKAKDEEESSFPIDDANAYPCTFRHDALPPKPSLWPQRPLLLRPTPNTNTHIRGVRFASSNSYEPLPGSGYCLGCTLPINTGKEEDGKSLVVDFETNLFIGTAMLRIQDCKPLTLGDNKSGKKGDADDYFEGKKRKFQAVIRGKFLSPDIPMSECITGQTFDKPAGYLPGRLIISGAVKIFSRLAPQLQAEFRGDSPRFLSPLASTAQSVILSSSSSTESASTQAKSKWTEEDDNYHDDEKKRHKYKFYAGSDASIEQGIAEPISSSPTSLLQTLPDASSYSKSSKSSSNQAARAKVRKKAFDKLHGQKAKAPTFDTNTEYTFEFYQHLLDFTGDDLALDLGAPLGRHGLAKILNGQPLKFMAAHQIKEKDGKERLEWLWGFDIWHEAMYNVATGSSK